MELDAALHFWIKFIQSRAFPDDKKQLLLTSEVSSSSKLIQLSPFIDHHGLIRVVGRLQNSKFRTPQKHPIILPPMITSRSSSSRIVICDTSTPVSSSLGLPSVELLDITLQRHHPPPDRKCITCPRHRAEAAKQLMGNLPEARVNPSLRSRAELVYLCLKTGGRVTHEQATL
ncbi:hypothetical protein Ocin01_19948 [Orchesella cincta]|uniref:Uncharacterized protein n=1 Tax=Orchesella cincta TaxID=48709 RepID=A0A1D2M1A6_ORCCI|nr:hypothetical protein Ocin01_19948 [Orchesella cincta]